MQFSAVTLLAYGAIYFAVTIVSVGTASPAGAVIPMVLIGAAWGRALGVVTRGLLDYEGNQHPHVRFYAIMGGAAALAGFFRLPLAVTAMVVEVTGNSVFTAPLFICCAVAKVTADRVAVGFISFMCRFNDYPILKEASAPPGFRDRTALDVMTELDKGIAYAPHMVGLGDSAAYGRHLLETTRHNSFPVVEDRARDWTLRGLIDRRALASAVARADADSEAAAPDAATAGGGQLRDGLLAGMLINPPCVGEGMPADRVYGWFVSLGLRRLVVVKDGTREATGIITRHDLHEAVLQWR
jgi:CBS domain-containing protein